MSESTGRRPRLRDEETQRRMIDAALERVRADGLHVAFDQLGFEELISSAGVARSTVYRKWPSREDFHRTVLLALLSDQIDLVSGFSPDEVLATVKHIVDDSPLLETVEGRRALLVEMSRRIVSGYLTTMMNSPEHQAHDTLIAVVDGDEAGLEKLREAQRTLLAGICDFNESSRGMLQMRWLPGVTASDAAVLGMVLMRGYVRAAHTLPPELVDDRVADPFDVGVERPWNTVTIGYTSMLLTMLEPDPDATTSHPEKGSQ